MKQAILAEPVLVGRERELEELGQNLESAIQGKGTTVFISGEAGSGKTRLTREFLNSARKRGVAVMAGWCLSDSAAPFFPFVEAFNHYFEALDVEEQPTSLQQPTTSFSIGKETQMLSGERGISAWLTDPTAPQKVGKPEVSPQVWKDQVFAGVAKTLHSISLQAPLILFIEDTHWADSASLALLHYLARAMHDSERILVLATFRSEELTADAEGRPHPLTDILRMMRREDLFTEIRLSNLNQASVSKIAENMMGGVLETKLAEKLTAESRGNPLFIVESLRMLSERKNLIEEDNEWRLAVDELGIPSKIKDIILRRLSVLKYAQRRVLDAASVIGEKFDVDLLSSVLGQDSLEVLEILNVVAHSTSLVGVEGSFYRFDHARSRETLYEELSLPLKKGYHGRVAEKLERTSQGSKLPHGDLAYHYAQAGNSEKAVKYSLSAGQDALAKWSNQEAIKHFSYVLGNISEAAENAETRRKAQEGLGDAYYASCMFKESIRVFEDLGNSVKSDVVRLRVFRKAADSAFQLGDASQTMELVKKAEPFAGADRLESARVLHLRGAAFVIQKMHFAALKDMKDALLIFEEEYSLWDIAKAGFTGAIQAQSGMFEEGLARCLRSVVLYEELGDFRWQMQACLDTAISFSSCLLNNEALEMYKKIIEIDEKFKTGDHLKLLWAYAWSARFFFELMGDFEKALAYSLKALEISKKTDSIAAHGVIYANLIKEYALMGDMKHSEEYFDKFMKLPSDVLNHYFLQLALTKAVFFAGKEKWEESIQCFKEWLEEIKSFPAPVRESLTKMYYGWALERQGRFEEARVQREEREKLYRKLSERFAHVSLQANLMVRREVTVGEEVEMRLDFVNVSRSAGLLVKAEAVIPSEGFKTTSMPPWCSLQNGGVEMKNREIGAFQVETVKLTLQAAKSGTFTLNPKAVYIDDLGETKTVSINPITITVQTAQPILHVLPGRISSGFDELDDLLGGGIPENCAVVLASSSSDERSLLIKRFLEAGAEAGETTFYITAEAGNEKALAEKYPSNFYLIVCNLQADAIVQDQTNIFKLKGIESLTEIDIALTRAFRKLNPAEKGPKRICLEIVSDVLLQHHAVTTRKWLSALLPNLKSKGFTTLAVIDQNMHPAEEAQAITGLFDGEIRIAEKETATGVVKSLRIRKLAGQLYSEKELVLTKEKLL